MFLHLTLTLTVPLSVENALTLQFCQSCSL
jgi:hypothetical protein